MTKLTLVALILGLPALVAADINRFNPRRDLERPDALRWNMRTQRPELNVAPSALPAWVSICRPNPAAHCKSQTPCPVPQHLCRCLSQPDCLSHASAPVLWPHSPRADEQRTADKEPRPKQAQVQDKHPAN
jgi:hypothetical protein